MHGATMKKGVKF